MSAPITMLNKWILEKISNNLKNREGCTVNELGYTNEGAKTVITDSLGFIYEINIKTIGRIQHE